MTATAIVSRLDLGAGPGKAGETEIGIAIESVKEKEKDETDLKDETLTEASSEMIKRVTEVCGDEIVLPVETVLALAGHHHSRQTLAQQTTPMLALPA